VSEFTNFNRCLIELGDQQIYATSASLSSSTSLARDTRLNGFSEDLAGATVNDPNLVPSGPLKGSLSFEFIIAEQHFNPIKSIFDISKSMSDGFIPIGRIGSYRFWNAAITSFSFTMEPFQLVRASAEYDIFGTVFEVGDKNLPDPPYINPAESLKGFGEVTASGINLQDENESFDLRMLKAEYTASVNRNINYTIRMNEQPGSKLYSGGVLPYRAALNEIDINCNVKANKIINYINHKGVIQMRSGGTFPEEVAVQLNLYGAFKENVYTKISDSSEKIDEKAYLDLPDGGGGKDLYSGPERESMHIASFGCSGKVTNQALNAQEGGYLSGGFSVRQVVK